MAKSIAPQDIAQLITLLSQSGLLPPEKLEQARQLAQPAANSTAVKSEGGSPDGGSPEGESIAETLQRWVESRIISPWQASQLAAGQFVLKLGTYQLVNESHPWEFGRAFHARHSTTGQDVTLKLLANRWLQAEELWKRTTVQLRTAQNLKNPHLLPFTSVSRAAQRTFLISQRAPSNNLPQLLQHFGPPSIGPLRRIICEAALGLHALHEAKLTHGALRPSAVTFTKEGTVQLVDLGLAPLAPSLFDLLRPSVPSPSGQETLPSTFIPPDAPPSDISEARRDVAMLARLGLYLLDGPSSTATEDLPVWWREAGAETEGARDSFRSILLAVSTWTDDSWSTRQLLEALKTPSSSDGKTATTPTATSQPTTTQPTTTQPTTAKPTTTQPTTAQPTANKPTKAPPPAAPQPATAEMVPEKHSLVVDTHRRRRRSLPAEDERMAGLQRLHRRRASLLYISIGMTLAATLLMAAVLFWPAEGIRLWTPSLASRPNGVQADAANREDGDAAENGAGEGGPEFPEPGQLEFPTPEAFAAGQPDSASTDNADMEPLAEERPEANDLAAAEEDGTGKPDGADLAMAAPQEQEDIVDAGEPAQDGAESSSTEEPPTMDLAEAATPPEATDEPTESPESEPAPPAPSPPPQVLANLPSRVGLPDPDEVEGTLVDLAPLKLEPNHTIEVTLLGGEHILKGNPILRLQHAEGGTAERKWDVVLVDRTGPPTPIARLDLEGEALRFRWEPASRKRTEAVQLMNCALNLALGTETHRMYLRQPVEAPAPTMNFAQGISSIRWDIPHAPEPTQCRLELIALEGPFPETRKYPSDSLNLSPSKQDYWILVGEVPEERGLTFRVETRARRQLELSITSLLFDGDAPPQQLSQLRDARINTANRRRWITTSQSQLQQATQRLAALNMINPNSAGSRTNQQELARQKNLAEIALESARVDAARIEAIEQWASSMHDVGKLHFRVYFEFAGNQVDLLHTAGADVEREL